MHPRLGGSAGGMQASARDLYRLVVALNSGKLIRPESFEIIRSLVPAPPNVPARADRTKKLTYGIQGGAPGVSAQLVIDPTGPYIRIVLCNSGPPMASAMGATIREWTSHLPKH